MLLIANSRAEQQWEHWDYVTKCKCSRNTIDLMGPVRGDRWRCGTVKQLEVNLCRAEIAELWAAIKAHRRKSGKLKEVRRNTHMHTHTNTHTHV